MGFYGRFVDYNWVEADTPDPAVVAIPPLSPINLHSLQQKQVFLKSIQILIISEISLFFYLI